MGTKGRFLFIILFLLLVSGLTIRFALFQRGQSRSSSLLEFSDITPCELEGNGFFVASISKMEFTPDKTLIFDKRQKRIFVFNDRMQFSYAFGEPGQGPGDLNQPEDFAVRGDRVFILDEISKRIETFSLDGRYEGRIYLSLPDDLFYSFPSAILIDGLGRLFVAYSLSSHLLDGFSPDGRFIKTYLERADPVMIYRKNIGNSSVLGWASHESIIHFNFFDGRFTEVFLDGTLGRQFQVADPQLVKIVHDILANIGADRSGAVQTDVLSFMNFSNFCVDQDGSVFVCQRKLKPDNKQRLWRFSPGGAVYSGEVNLGGDQKIKAIYCARGRFYFVTDDEELFLANRGNK